MEESSLFKTIKAKLSIIIIIFPYKLIEEKLIQRFYHLQVETTYIKISNREWNKIIII